MFNMFYWGFGRLLGAAIMVYLMSKHEGVWLPGDMVVYALPILLGYYAIDFPWKHHKQSENKA